MKVSSQPTPYPTLFDHRGQQKQTALHTGKTLAVSRVSHDLLEISPVGRQLDVIMRDAVKVSIPSTPKDDINEMMKMFKPEDYEKMKDHFAQNRIKEGFALLHSFTKLIPGHPEWLQAYRESARR
ncbi:hypothetical protein M3212_14215 [Alkalihalobacillus oceani]|uniref:hypothetical protein n=1 Tax=Halalkalibacter oceani TaxID=1653776 RepID=UPI00203AB93A|nr:hypothetical protein [Halalkalibacter oceani]MCM3761927.1 hypothetical protein [Halalkalibacter oceani]